MKLIVKEQKVSKLKNLEESIDGVVIPQADLFKFLRKNKKTITDVNISFWNSFIRETRVNVSFSGEGVSFKGAELLVKDGASSGVVSHDLWKLYQSPSMFSGRLIAESVGGQSTTVIYTNIKRVVGKLDFV